MLYRVVRPLVGAALKVFFRKIYLSHTGRIPKDKPVILAANHPTAFMEPCVLACNLDRPLYFLVRGDFFAKGVFAYLLGSLHMLPVFRLKDGGYQNLKFNYSTFENCYKALKNNKTIMILAEGRTIHEKRLRPIRKGTARIALGALQSYNELEDVYIIPVAVNFTYADQFRSEVMIDFEEPLMARDYFALFQKNPPKAITAFTEELTERLKRKVIIIQNPEDDELTEQFLVLNRSLRNASIFPIRSNSSAPLEEEKKIADLVNSMPKGKKEKLKSGIDAYFKKLDQHGIDKQSQLDKNRRLPLHSILLVLGFLPFLLGFAWNYLPVRLAKYITDKRVHHVEFYSPVLMAAGVGTYLVYLIIWLVGILMTVHWLWLVLLIAMPMLGFFALLYMEFYKRWKQARVLKRLDAKILERLKEEREGILLASGRAVSTGKRRL